MSDPLFHYYDSSIAPLPALRVSKIAFQLLKNQTFSSEKFP